MGQNEKVQIVCAAGIVSGKEVVCLLLARSLRDFGWNPEFVTSSWGDGDFVRRLDQANFLYWRLRLGFISASFRREPLLMTLDQIRYWPLLAYKYSRLVAAASPRAIIHTNWHHALLLLPFLNPRRDIFWVHEVFPKTSRYSRVLGAISKKVGRVVCVSQAVARSVLALGVQQSRIMVIHNGVPQFDAVVAPGNRFPIRLGIVGQVGPWKGHDDLVDAIALLARDGTQVDLRIIGTGAQDQVCALKKRIDELNLTRIVQWCGFVSDLNSIYSDIDVCIVPSRSEDPLPTVALEAGGFGRPVICSSRGGLPEIVIDGVTGFVHGAGQPSQLAEAINKFVKYPDLIKTMGTAAQKRIRKEFSLVRFVSQFIAAIEGLDE